MRLVSERTTEPVDSSPPADSAARDAASLARVALAGARDEAGAGEEVDSREKSFGRVVDELGNGIGGARLAFFEGTVAQLPEHGEGSSTSARSDERGEFVVSLKSHCEYVVVAEAPGFETAIEVWNPGESEVVSLRSFTRPLRVSGRVVDEAGRPFREFEVSARYDGGASERLLRWTRQVGADGAFDLDLVLDERAPSSVVLGARAPGFAVSEGVLDAGRSEGLVLVLKPGGSVWGVVQSEDGEVVADARVAARFGPGVEDVATFTDELGSFELTLPRGNTPSSLWVLADGYAPRLFGAAEFEGGWEGVTLRLDSCAGVSGVVTDASGSALPGVLVRAWQDAGGQEELAEPAIWWRVTATDAAGRFAFSCTPAGALEIAAFEGRSRSSTMRCRPTRLELIAGDSRSIELVVGRAARLRGSVEIEILSEAALWLELRSARPGETERVYSSTIGQVGEPFTLLGPDWSEEPIDAVLRISLGRGQYVDRDVTLLAPETALLPIVFAPKDLVEFDRERARFEAR